MNRAAKKLNRHLAEPADPLQPCWWMQAGLVDYKLCDRNYDCEHCAFDDIFQGKAVDSRPSLPVVAFDKRGRQRHCPIHDAGCTAADFEVRSTFFYHPGHTWTSIEEAGTARVGTDDFGQRLLGRVYSVAVPDVGTTVIRGEACWTITHQAGVATLVSPVSGKIKEVNSTLFQRPSLVNRDPHGLGWTVVIEPSDLKTCLKGLRYGQKVRAWLEVERQRLIQKIGDVLAGQPLVVGATMNDGGILESDSMSALTAAQMRQVIDAFFPLPLCEETGRNNSISVPDRR